MSKFYAKFCFVLLGQMINFVQHQSVMARVFISYSKKDYIGTDGKVIPGNAVDKVCKALSDNGVSYWIDRKGLDPGVTYASIIASKIKDCDVFLFLATQNANNSDWTLREISTAIEFGKKVIPIRLDHSSYADSVALYLSSVQYVDWMELGEGESISRIVSRIKSVDGWDAKRVQPTPKLNTFTKVVLHCAVLFLVLVFAMLTYQFLWSRSLRSSEIMGGLVGYVCEFGVLLSIYYIVRMMRMRKCTFAFPLLLTIVVFLAGMMLSDADVMFSGILLFLGWLAIFAVCFMGKERSFFKLMSKEELLMKATDPENIIFVYLFIKAVILVLAHYFNLSMKHSLVSPFLF